MKADAYVKLKSMFVDNIYKSYFLVKGKCIELLKIKIKQSKGWNETSTKTFLLNINKIIHSIISNTRSIYLF